MRFGRKQDDHEAAAVAEEEAAQAASTPRGPLDIAEVSLDEDDPTRVDLGSLIVTGKPGIELRLQVDDATQQVAAALMVMETAAVELRAFAAPRNGDLWGDVRGTIKAEAARQGGTATEVEGPWGPELHLVVTGMDDQGRTVTQPSRIVGINGPRWMLRATFFGAPATEPEADHPLIDAVNELVVNRGSGAMAPGDFLPLTLPAGAKRMA